MGIETVPVTWAQAQSKCEDQGGKLASITTWEIQNWIIGRFGLAQDRWIGGTDAATEGTFVWSRSASDPWQFTHWYDCNPTNDNTKNCVKVKDASDGMWDIDNCDASLYRYLCQKQTATSLFWNEFGSGNKYAYIEHKTCIPLTGWTSARDMCQALGDGADLAHIPSSTHETFISDTFSSHAFQSNYFWIGLNDIASEGTFVWENGASSGHRNWKSGQPGSHNNLDCVTVKSSNMEWEMKKCDLVNIKGALCRKKITTRKKRDAGVLESGNAGKSVERESRAATYSGERSDPVRVRRSVNTETQREATCTELWGGSSLYWRYDYEVPGHCWSECRESLLLH